MRGVDRCREGGLGDGKGSSSSLISPSSRAGSWVGGEAGDAVRAATSFIATSWEVSSAP